MGSSVCAPERCSAHTTKAARAENRSPQTTKAAAPRVLPWGPPPPATETSFWGDRAQGGFGLCTLTSDMGYKDKLLLGRGYRTKSIRVPKSNGCCREWSMWLEAAFPESSQGWKACHAESNAQNGNCIKKCNNKVWNSSLNNEQMNLSKLNTAYPALKRSASASKYIQSDFRECQNNRGQKESLEAIQLTPH